MLRRAALPITPESSRNFVAAPPAALLLARLIAGQLMRRCAGRAHVRERLTVVVADAEALSRASSEHPENMPASKC